MWGFNKKIKFKDSGLLKGFTDWHSHILPGVDDGVATITQSIEILKEFEKAGFRKVWLTPHIMEDFPNTPETLKKKFEELNSNWTGELQLDLGAEHMLDSTFIERLDNEEVMPIGRERDHLLVETSYYSPPYGMNEMIYEAQQKGYKIILAHPERYRYMQEEEYKKLKNKGFLFQMNMMSLLDFYGEQARKKAEWLITNDLVDLMGTDIHRMNPFFERVEKGELNKKIYDKMAALSDSQSEI